MSRRILKLFIIRSYREAYYQLSNEERDRFWAKVEENEVAVGANLVVGCDSLWCNEAIANWGVIEYPDWTAVQNLTRVQNENQVFRYVDSETYLGIPLEDIQTAVPDFPNPLYQLFMIKNQNNDAWESLPKEEQDRIFGCVLDSIQKHGGVMVAGSNCEWSNEEYSGFGVTAWPNLEAEQAHFKDLAALSWHRYFYSKTILGTTAA